MLFGKKKLPQINIGNGGFSVGKVHVPWSAVASIRAYKLDLITYDLLCFGVAADGHANPLEISEEWPGFDALSKEFESRFAFPTDWWDSVVHPAFKTNETLLFQRA